MGYRSEAALCLNRQTKIEFMESISKLDSETGQAVDDCLKSASHFTDPDTGDEIWHWERIKWYSDYSDIAFMEKFISKADQHGYRFLRIGEDYDDTQIDGLYLDDPFGISLVRQIEFDKPEE